MILVTGCSGFVGYYISKKLLQKKFKVLGIDNNNNYYDTRLKKNRLKNLLLYKNFYFNKMDISSVISLEKIFKKYNIHTVINLAAQAGVRYSLEEPSKYFDSNIKGFFNIIYLSKKYGVKKFIYASSSSVYGNNKTPYIETQDVSNPINFYAMSKISNELMARSYFNTYGFQSIGLRLFSVYGPWGRPDMAYFKFTKSILNKEVIYLYNQGRHVRDFTYIDDVVDAIYLIIIDKRKDYGCDIFNIGSNKPQNLINLVKNIENITKIKPIINFLPKQIGEASYTHSNNTKLYDIYKFKPKTKFKTGLFNFVNWFKDYYNYK